MTIEQTEQFLSTDAKVLIKNWKAIRKIIEEHTTPIKKTQKSAQEQDSQAIFSDQQMQDALNGPYQHFIKQKLSAYAKLSFVRLQLTIHQDDSLKSPHHDKTTEIPTKLLEKHSIADIDKLQTELDELTEQHHEQWQEQIKQWNQQLISTLQSVDIPLNEIETKEFEDKEPLSELFDRFTDLNLEPPKLDKSEFNYEKYLKLKITLAIHSSLGRRHQPNTDQDVQTIIKKLKNDFNQISTQEKQLIEKQNEATSKLIEPIAALISNKKKQQLK